MDSKTTIADWSKLTTRASLASDGLCKLLSAAVVDKRFCNLLLNDPEKAVTDGYMGEAFNICPEELDLVVSIRAANLTDLATQINKAFPD
jgi:hypothetical protein